MENLGGWELLLIVLLGLFIFGPDRLPKAISDGVKMLRQVRGMARNATSDLSKELGTDIELEDLRPRTFLRKHLLSEEDELALRKPLESAYGSLRSDLQKVSDSVTDVATAINEKPATPPPAVAGPERAGGSDSPGDRKPEAGTRRSFDIDAT
ncbi:MAG: preprotein translocase subunit TatB [Dactylosporangium sp.]|nr:twin-arginine translocase TatA/TatE family subunit [Dactylosporangium sp.]NNJ62620.1 preprotein translocase subunit TatB [Dactylosporangium sp.]